eukprot:gb/GECH01005442.1/.p1 GENE.gb/GECH01005442.1/~~gb/GECH01005442.1/.p1  ORF type:complete len:198 (+),score=40.93 gb/GECH01005442.1/:1-594(+)
MLLLIMMLMHSKLRMHSCVLDLNLSLCINTISEAQAIFIGGGNTFRLLKTLYEINAVSALRKAVLEQGIPYIGTSAGTNVATVNIKTTNDMPIVEPPTFNAMALVPFNVNAHYISQKPDATHMGESRDQRLTEFFEENQGQYLVGLREGAMLHVEGHSVQLLGINGARIFDPQQPFTDGKLNYKEYETGASLDFLLK